MVDVEPAQTKPAAIAVSNGKAPGKAGIQPPATGKPAKDKARVRARPLGFDPRRWGDVCRHNVRLFFLVHGVNAFRVLHRVPQWRSADLRQPVRHDTIAGLRFLARISAFDKMAENAVGTLVLLGVPALLLVVPALHVAPGLSFWLTVLNYITSIAVGTLIAALAAVLLIALVWFFAGVGCVLSARRWKLSYRAAFQKASNNDFPFILATILLVSLAYSLVRWRRPPAFLEGAVALGAWSVYFFGAMIFLVMVQAFVLSLLIRYSRRRHPDGRLVIGLTDYVGSLDALDDEVGAWDEQDRRRVIRDLEELATEFKRDWPKRVGTGYLHADNTAHEWSRRVAAKLLDSQFPLLLGVGQKQHQIGETLTVLGSFLSGSPQGFPEDESEPTRIMAWWRRLGRVVAITLTGTMAIAFLLIGFLQPELPDQLTRWGWSPSVVNHVRLGTGIHPQLLTVGAAFLGLTAKLITPDVSTASAGRRRRWHQ